MIVLDTNVISEALRGPQESPVKSWLDAQQPAELFLCAPVLAELRYGIERLPASRRRDLLQDALQAYEQNVFGGRILTVDRTCAYAYGRVVAERQRRGRPIDVMDALIAAVALVHEATLATRNLADFDGLGIALVNPFELA